MTDPKVYCVVVTYRPNAQALQQVLQSICSQTPHVILVDNTEDARQPLDTGNASYLHLGYNAGIAAAQNRGIEQALAQGAHYIWLSDQDTVYPKGFATQMLAFAQACAAQGMALGAIAPAYLDTHKACVQSFVRHAPFTQFFTPEPGANAISHAIASGTFIPAQALRTVGLMQESLFIDWVDLEWCWRAKNVHGLQNIASGDVLIQHTLGDGWVKFMGRKVTVRSPIRHYFMVRNAAHIALHSQSATWPIRIEIFAKAMAWTLIFPWIAPRDKWQHLKSTSNGLWHGIINRMGPWPGKAGA